MKAFEGIRTGVELAAIYWFLSIDGITGPWLYPAVVPFFGWWGYYDRYYEYGVPKA